MKEYLSIIGEDIKNIRTKLEMSQEKLSLLSGVERAQLSRIESGEVSGVAYLTIMKILNSLGKELRVHSIDEKKYDVHPVVKWAGGKTQLLSNIKTMLPKSFNRYFEPFVGGGALLLEIQPDEFYINDLNNNLMLIYSCFKNTKKFNELKKLLEIHEANHCEEYFLKIRNMDREKNYILLSDVEKAARTIYLNKACFNGLYRVNSNGFFNVPSGKKEKVNCFDRDNFLQLKKYFSNTKCHFTSCDFEKALADAKEGDFVYLDPPYDNYEEKKVFTSYDKDSFGKEEQIRLANTYKELSKKGVYVMLSNHNTDFINELYKGFNINVVQAKRMINANATGRGNIEEVIITNYNNEGIIVS